MSDFLEQRVSKIEAQLEAALEELRQHGMLSAPAPAPAAPVIGVVPHNHKRGFCEQCGGHHPTDGETV
jgi:hypothetical protein